MPDEAVVKPMCARDRRTLLAARAMLRWHAGPPIVWPPGAEGSRQADEEWLIDLLALVFEATVVLGELQDRGLFSEQAA